MRVDNTFEALKAESMELWFDGSADEKGQCQKNFSLCLIDIGDYDEAAISRRSYSLIDMTNFMVLAVAFDDAY